MSWNVVHAHINPYIHPTKHLRMEVEHMSLMKELLHRSGKLKPLEFHCDQLVASHDGSATLHLTFGQWSTISSTIKMNQPRSWLQLMSDWVLILILIALNLLGCMKFSRIGINGLVNRFNAVDNINPNNFMVLQKGWFQAMNIFLVCTIIIHMQSLHTNTEILLHVILVSDNNADVWKFIPCFFVKTTSPCQYQLQIRD